MYIPSCDEDGYYRKVQCDQSRGECWCVDQHGGEMMGTRIHGNPDCGKRGAFGKQIFLTLLTAGKSPPHEVINMNIFASSVTLFYKYTVSFLVQFLSFYLCRKSSKH